MPKAMIIGHRGQLGHDLTQQFADYELQLMTREQMDVRDAASVDTAFDRLRPDLVLNCAAFHRVDDCEDQYADALSVNAYGALCLARAARRIDATLVHYSTDYVFDGPGPTPHPESKAINPRSIYAASKAAGEALIAATHPNSIVIRSCGLYGYKGSREKGTNFIEMMIGLGRSGKPLKIVDDQVCTPTATLDLAIGTRQLVDSESRGLFHLTNTGECTWFRFASEAFQLMGLSPNVIPVPSSQFPQKAKRPDYSVLDNQRFRAEGHDDLLDWQEALARYVHGRKANGRE